MVPAKIAPADPWPMLWEIPLLAGNQIFGNREDSAAA
jgi:hypothetical protein